MPRPHGSWFQKSLSFPRQHIIRHACFNFLSRPDQIGRWFYNKLFSAPSCVHIWRYVTRTYSLTHSSAHANLRGTLMAINYRTFKISGWHHKSYTRPLDPQSGGSGGKCRKQKTETLLCLPYGRRLETRLAFI